MEADFTFVPDLEKTLANFGLSLNGKRTLLYI